MQQQFNVHPNEINSHVNSKHMVGLKFIRVHEDLCDELRGIDAFGDSFSDVIRRLLDSYYVTGRSGEREATTAAMGRDDIKARLKKRTATPKRYLN